jgi:hypothetical protein
MIYVLRMRVDEIVLLCVVLTFVVLIGILVCIGIRIANVKKREHEKYMVDIREIPVGVIIQNPVQRV